MRLERLASTNVFACSVSAERVSCIGKRSWVQTCLARVTATHVAHKSVQVSADVWYLCRVIRDDARVCTNACAARYMEATVATEGVHAFIEREFWPPYSDSAAAQAVPVTVSAGGGDGRGQGMWRRRAATPGGRLRRAIQRGRVVDLQVREWCEATVRGRRWKPPRGRRVNPYTKRLVAALGRWGWKPVAAQVAASVRRWRLATRADLLVRCARTGKRILLEIKTCSGAWNQDTGARFYPPHAHIVSCPLNHAMAQLTVTLALLSNDRRPREARAGALVPITLGRAAELRAAGRGDRIVQRVVADDAYVVVIGDTYVRRHQIAPWCVELCADAQRRLERRAAALDADGQF